MPLSRHVRRQGPTPAGAGDRIQFADGHLLVGERMATKAEIARIRLELGQVKPKSVCLFSSAS